MTIRKKLTLIAALTMLCMLGIGGIGYIIIKEVSFFSNELFEKEAMPILKIKEMEKEAQAVMVSLLLHIGSSDPKTMVEFEKKIATAQKQIHDSLAMHDQIEGGHIEHAKETSDFLKSWHEFEELTKTLQENSRIFLKDDAQALLQEKGKHLHDQSVYHLAAMVVVHHEKMTILKNLTSELHQRSMVLMPVFTLLASMVVMGFFGLLIRSIILAVDNITQTVVATAADGNFSRRIQSPCQDELGRAMHAFNHLLETLQLAIQSVNKVVGATAEGDFSLRVDLPLMGDLEILQRHTNRSIDEIETTFRMLRTIITNLAEGRFECSLQELRNDSKGEYQEMITLGGETMTRLCAVVREIEHVMNGVADGDLTRRVTAESRGELETLKHHINKSMDSLSSVLTIVSDANRFVVNRAAQSTAAVVMLSHGAHFQFDAIEASEKNVEVARDRILTVIHNVEVVSQKANDAASQLVGGQQRMKEAILSVGNNAQIATDKVSHAKEMVNTFVERIKSLAQHAVAIGRIVSDVGNIAEKINALSFNAAIQAAKAGEAGKGFSVLADEVRVLAKGTRDFVVTIQKTIDEQVALARQSEEDVASIDAEMAQGAELVQKTSNLLAGLVDVSGEMERIILLVVDAEQLLDKNMANLEGQAQSVEEIARTVGTLGDIGRNNAAAADELSVTMKKLASVAEESTTQLDKLQFRR